MHFLSRITDHCYKEFPTQKGIIYLKFLCQNLLKYLTIRTQPEDSLSMYEDQK